MPRDGTSGVFTRTSNSFSNPIIGTVISPSDATSYFNDLDLGITGSLACPVSSTDNAIVRFDGTTGKFSQNSGVTVSDSAVVAGATISGDSNTLQNIAASSIKNNTIGSLTHKGSPATSDILLIQDQAASGTNKYCTIAEAVGAIGSGVTSLNGQTGAITLLNQACGRLTLTTGTPIMASDVAGATTIYYTPFAGHRYVVIYDGTQLVPYDIGGELSQATTDSTKSPAAVANNSNYDLFVWNDSGTFRCTRGPAWSSDTARGTGAGTTELELFQGLYVNKVAVTNGPAARKGTYVGTVRSNGSATIDWKLGTSATGGGESRLCVWNTYNRRRTAAKVNDSTASWSYTSTTIRSADNSTTNRVSLVVGLQEDAINTMYACALALSGTNALAYVGMALDATNALDARGIGLTGSAALQFGMNIVNEYAPQIGFHFIQATEAGDGTNATSFYQSTNNGRLIVTTLM